jgi:YesN/AraC family two-component response regulator
LKLRSKNRILYDRTIELAQVQLQLQDQLDSFEGMESIDQPSRKNGHSSNQIQTIDGELKEIIMEKLEKLENANFFLDQGCNLHQLADKLKTNHKYLSQVINQEKKSNFNNYINELRINYLLAKLLKDEEFRNSKLSYIAVSVGYNNLNTFNAAFKKRQGILPSYFIDQLNSKAKA